MLVARLTVEWHKLLNGLFLQTCYPWVFAHYARTQFSVPCRQNINLCQYRLSQITLFHIYFMPFHFSQEIWTRWSFFTFSLIFCKWPVFILQKDGELKITKSFLNKSSFVMRLQMKLTDSSLASLIRLQLQTQCENYYTNKYFCFSAVIFIRKLSVDL